MPVQKNLKLETWYGGCNKVAFISNI